MNNSIKKMAIPIQFLSRFILGYIFLYASIDKIVNPIAFSSNIDNYHISPIYLNNIAALIIPWIEFIIGIFLLFGCFRFINVVKDRINIRYLEKYVKASSLISIFLLIFFIFILSQAYYRGIDVHCGCFKSVSSLSSSNLKYEMLNRIIQDIIFLGLAIIVYFYKFNNEE